MSWLTKIAQQIREAWDLLFYSSHTRHLEAEILYLKDELSKAKAERDKVQSLFNSINPFVARQNKPQQVVQPTGPVIKRWSVLEAERTAEIEADRIKKIAEAQSKTQVA